MAASTWVLVLLLLAAAPRQSHQCGPGSNFPTAKVLETEQAGFVLMNVTAEAGVSWSISLKADPSFMAGSPLYRWLDAAVLINSTAVSGFHLVQLNYTLDLEFVHQTWGEKLSVLSYTVTCHVSGNPDVNYEWFLEVEAINEFAPEFVGAPFNVSVPEDAALQTLVMTLRDNARDLDVVTSSPSDIHEFNMVHFPLPWTQNMSGLFSMEDKQHGEVRVAQALDFESFPGPDEAFVQFNITVWDLSRWNGTSTLTINVLDVDDLPPHFYHPGCGPYPCEVVYSCEVASTFTGVVTSMEPDNITAEDGDTLNYNITYHIKTVTGLPSSDVDQYISIDTDTGEFSIVQLQGVSSQQLFIIITAEEVSEKSLSKDSTLIVSIRHPEQTTATLNSTTQPLNTGFSREEDGDSMVVAVAVLAVFVILALVGLVVLVLYMKKRSDKPIYPASSLKDNEVEDEEKRGGGAGGGGGGSRTDSGQWSMSGLPSPGPHAGSSAPAHTRLHTTTTTTNGHLANGHVAGKPSSRKGHRKKVSRSATLMEEDSPGEHHDPTSPWAESRPESGGGRSPPVGGIGEDDLDTPVFAASPFPGPDSPLEHAPRLQGSAVGSHDETAARGSHHGEVEEEEEEMEEEDGGPLTTTLPARRLPPLPLPPSHPPPLTANGAGTPPSPPPPRRSRASRKQRREQVLAQQRQEVYDGTKTYPMAADDSFFKDSTKQKVKMTSRGKKKAQQYTSHWFTIDNDYSEL
ncbi:uncharacterized protein LOC143292614 [Babylonia areolata]|uniref:uncharacterized protein LOC143292614 n=1 Tax=Babylonia areolata TaxID=304850 RepID=UPI003FD2BDD3